MTLRPEQWLSFAGLVALTDRNCGSFHAVLSMVFFIKQRQANGTRSG